MNFVNTQIYKWCVSLKTKSPLHIGDSDQEIIRDQEDMPLIPGTSLAGAFRSYLETSRYKGLVKELFGQGMTYDPYNGLFFSDGVCEKKPILEFRTGVSISGKTRTAREGQLFERIFIPAGAHFKWNLTLKTDKDSAEQMLEAVDYLLHALHRGLIRLGAYKSIGGGLVMISDCQYVHYDCSEEADLFAYINQEREYEPYPLTKDIYVDSVMSFYLKGKTDTPLLIGTSSARDSDTPDVTYMRTGKGDRDPIIPGSSLKGVLRHQVEKITNILSLLNKDTYIETLFGHSKNSSRVKSGSVQFDDTIIRDKKIEIYYRTSINPLTGSVRDGALLDEETVSGDFDLTMNFHFTEEDEVTYTSAALLLFALRDLAMQRLSIGSRASIGYGFLDIEEIIIEKESDKVIIDMKKEKIEDSAGLLERFDEALEKASKKEEVSHS